MVVDVDEVDDEVGDAISDSSWLSKRIALLPRRPVDSRINGWICVGWYFVIFFFSIALAANKEQCALLSGPSSSSQSNNLVDGKIVGRNLSWAGLVIPTSIFIVLSARWTIRSIFFPSIVGLIGCS